MRKLIAYLKDVYDEMVHKVTWPTWEELQVQALVVIIATTIIATVVLILDITFKGIMQAIYSMFY